MEILLSSTAKFCPEIIQVPQQRGQPIISLPNQPLELLYASKRRQVALGMGLDSIQNRVIVMNRTLPSPYNTLTT